MDFCLLKTLRKWVPVCIMCVSSNVLFETHAWFMTWRWQQSVIFELSVLFQILFRMGTVQFRIAHLEFNIFVKWPLVFTKKSCLESVSWQLGRGVLCWFLLYSTSLDTYMQSCFCIWKTLFPSDHRIRAGRSTRSNPLPKIGIFIPSNTNGCPIFSWKPAAMEHLQLQEASYSTD